MTCHIRKPKGFRKLGSLSYAGAGTLRWDGLRRGLLRDAAAASPFSLNLPHEPAPFEAVVVAWDLLHVGVGVLVHFCFWILVKSF